MLPTRTILLALLPACSLLFMQAAAQKVTVSGIIIDSLDRKPLDSVQVLIKHNQQVTPTWTNSKGKFYSAVWTGSDSLSLAIQHKNFNPIVLKGKDLQRLLEDTIILSPRSKMMENIVVKARIPAIQFRNDTTEYMVDSFDRRRNAMIGELLQDLPGMEIDEEGNILHMGKKVSRILVNGEEFFGGDQSVALENIPADLVSKIQVMDTRTRAQIFNGVSATGEDRTINIRLRPGLQAFGSGQLHAATTGGYNSNLMANSLKDKRQLGILANVHSQVREGLSNNRLPSRQLMGKLYFKEKLGKHLNLNASVQEIKNTAEQETSRSSTQYFRADSFFLNQAHNLSLQSSRNSHFITGIEYQPSDKFFLTLQLTAQLNRYSSEFNSSNQILEKGILKNFATRKGSTYNDTRNIHLNGSMHQKFRKEGRLLSVEYRLTNRKNSNDQFNEAGNDYFDNGSFIKQEQLHQHILQEGRYYNTVIGFNYYEPLFKNTRLHLSQFFDYNHSISTRNTFNVDSVSKQEVLDSTYSIAWWGSIFNRRTLVSLEYKGKKLNITAGIQSIQNKEERMMEDGQVTVQEQKGWTPQVNGSLPFNEKQGLRFNVSGAFMYPSLDQIRPVPDNSNPLFIRLGNPNLRSSFNQQYNLSYNSNKKEGKIFSVTISYKPVRNSIVHISYYDDYRRRIGQFVNVNGIHHIDGHWNLGKYLGRSTSGFSWNLSGHAGLGKNVFFDNRQLLTTREYRIRQGATLSKVLDQNKGRSRISAGLTMGYTRNLSPHNTNGINTENFTVNQKIDFSHRIKSKLDWQLYYQASHHRLNYNAGKQNLLIYTDHSINNRLSLELSKKLSIQSNTTYRFNGRLPHNSNYREQLLLNLDLSLAIFKNEKGMIFLGARDILNQGAEISRYAGENFVEDIQSSRQIGYYTIGFQYNWARGVKTKTVNMN